ncbi:MAG: DUF4175 domain-containing protein [Acetatifactor sp.]|nr:DUF4175 domain-containing protein [Acetatifactor sp.]
MDTFMDRLAQKFTAQEMIKANAAAEAEELNRLREQVQEYTECLDRMQQICAEMERAAENAKGRVDEARLDTDGLREQLMEIWQNVQTMQQNSAGAPDDSSQRVLAEQLDSSQRVLAEQLDSSQRMLAEQLDSMRSAQDAQFDNSQRMLAEQLDGMRSAQDAQFDNSQRMLTEKFDSMRSAQDAQFANLRGLQADQIEDMRGMQAQQIETIRSMQDAQVETIKGSIEDQLDGIRSMVKAQISGIKNGQDGQLDGLRSVLDEQNNTMAAKLGEIQTNLESQLEGSNDFIHKECVKVYRNVQAVVGEENNKQTDNLEYLIKPMTGKMKNVFNISMAALVFSLIGVVLQVLNILGIIK